MTSSSGGLSFLALAASGHDHCVDTLCLMDIFIHSEEPVVKRSQIWPNELK